MTRWKPNLAPVEGTPESREAEDARLNKMGNLEDSPGLKKPEGDVSIIEGSSQSERSLNGDKTSDEKSGAASGAHNPLDDASIDDLGSFLKLNADEKPNEEASATQEPQKMPASSLERIKPYTRYAVAAVVILVAVVTSYAVYKIYYSDTQVSSTVYILNNFSPVHEEASRIADPASLSNFVQRFFVSMILERSLSSNNETKFATVSGMLDWFKKNLKIDREMSDHAARITFNLSGSDPVLMSKLIDGYVSSYIESKAAIDSQTTAIESNVTQQSVADVTQPPATANLSTNNLASSAPATKPAPEDEAISSSLKQVDERLKKLDEVDQEYVSALRLLAKDRLIGVSENNVFRGFMPESELASNSALAKLQSRVVELAVQKNALQVKFAPNSREVQAIDQEIRGIREAMRQYLNEQRQFVQARKGELLSERAEILRQKAIVSIESEVVPPKAQAPQQTQVAMAPRQTQVIAPARRIAQGNLPSGRIWYVGQDGTTIIAEPTPLGRSAAVTAANTVSGGYSQDLPPRNNYRPINHQVDQFTNNPLQNPYNSAPVFDPRTKQTQAPYQYNAAPNGHTNPSAFVSNQKGPEQTPQIGHGDIYSTPHKQDFGAAYKGHAVPAPTVPTPNPRPQSHYANPSPLHTGVGQSPMMSSGLGSKYYFPNSNNYGNQTQTLRGSY